MIVKIVVNRGIRHQFDCIRDSAQQRNCCTSKTFNKFRSNLGSVWCWYNSKIQLFNYRPQVMHTAFISERTNWM